MIKMEVYNAIVDGLREGNSISYLSKKTNCDRKTVRKIKHLLEHYEEVLGNPQSTEEEIQQVKDEIQNGRKYNSENRVCPIRKFTQEMDLRIDKLIMGEEKKKPKQRLTVLQIHQILVSEGHDISYTALVPWVAKKRAKHREVFIRQDYEYGQRGDFDYGDAVLVIDGEEGIYQLMFFVLTKSKFAVCLIYKHANMDSFIDAHDRIFQKIGGVPEEIAYDNMRNVVSKFKPEKALNDNLIKISTYYNFKVTLTNCRRGNEKGTVERNVKTITNKAFAIRNTFASLDEAEEYLQKALEEINSRSDIEEERKHLQKPKPEYGAYRHETHAVDKYQTVWVDGNNYSVPEHLTQRKLDVKIGARKIAIYANRRLVAIHERLYGKNGWSIDIRHYTKTLMRKQGALHNSLALKSQNELFQLYKEHYSDKKGTRKFIEILHESRDKSISNIIKTVREEAARGAVFESAPQNEIASQVIANSLRQTAMMSKIHNIG